MKNVFFFSHINAIGGIETFFYYLAKKYKDWDITVYYYSGDYKQLKRLAQYVRVKHYNGEKIKCDKCFFAFNISIIDNVEAKEYIQILHGDYRSNNVVPYFSPKLTRWLGVSQAAVDGYESITGIKTELAYNPIVIDTPKKVLHLISCTRLTAEKGGERMERMVKKLDEAGIPYQWDIYTDSPTRFNSENINIRRPRLDIIDYIADADYLVQLSSSEGYCYSVVEALCVGTPVIVTDLPVFRELGIENGKNGFILDMNIQNIDIDAIYKGVPEFKYKPPQDRYNKILARGKSTYDGKAEELDVTVECTRPYWDLEMNRNVATGETYTTSAMRAEILEEKEVAKIIHRG